MKKFLAAILITAASHFCYAQDVNFKVQYLPNHIYNLSGSITMNLNTDLSKVPQIADQLTKQGISEPINAVMVMELTGAINTGTASADKTFPFTMNVNMPSMTVNVNGKQMPIPMPKASATNIFGHISAEGRMSVDSLNGKKIPDSVAQKTLGMMNNMFKMVKFPDHPMKIGESFTQQIPFDIPMLSGLSNNIATTYKLVSIDGNKANFDVTQDMNMHMDVKGKVNINLTGGGTGKMVYDISNNFFSTYTTNSNMQIAVKGDNVDVTGNLKIDGGMTYVISGK